MQSRLIFHIVAFLLNEVQPGDGVSLHTICYLTYMLSPSDFNLR